MPGRLHTWSYTDGIGSVRTCTACAVIAAPYDDPPGACIPTWARAAAADTLRSFLAENHGYPEFVEPTDVIGALEAIARLLGVIE
ncbi:MAG: hypothetical protein ACSLE9_09100 [Burkholderiaceae bacterium]